MKRTGWLLALLLLTIAVDVFNKSYYLSVPEGMQEKVYWTGQSVSFLMYCMLAFGLCSWIYSTLRNKTTFSLMFISGNWVFFGLQDLFDEYSDTFMVISKVEISSFILSIFFSIYMIKIWKKK